MNNFRTFPCEVLNRLMGRMSMMYRNKHTSPPKKLKNYYFGRTHIVHFLPEQGIFYSFKVIYVLTTSKAGIGQPFSRKLICVTPMSYFSMSHAQLLYLPLKDRMQQDCKMIFGQDFTAFAIYVKQVAIGDGGTHWTNIYHVISFTAGGYSCYTCQGWQLLTWEQVKENSISIQVSILGETPKMAFLQPFSQSKRNRTVSK